MTYFANNPIVCIVHHCCMYMQHTIVVLHAVYTVTVYTLCNTTTVCCILYVCHILTFDIWIDSVAKETPPWFISIGFPTSLWNFRLPQPAIKPIINPLSDKTCTFLTTAIHHQN